MFQTKVAEKLNTHILCSVTFFPENPYVYETMWKNVVQPERLQRTVHAAHALCMLNKTIDTEYEYLLLFHGNNGWLRLRARILRYRTWPILF